MKNIIEQEIEKLNAEIKELVRIVERLKGMLKDAPVTAEPKKRGRKKKPGLPSATPPASEANHAQSKVPF